MEWVAYCTVCGELDRAPNGPMMESTARVHRRDTGHTTIIGYEPSIIMTGKMVEIPLEKKEGFYWEVTNMVRGEILADGTPYETIAETVSEAQHSMDTEHAHFGDEHLVIKIFDKSPDERSGLTFEPHYTESYWIEGSEKAKVRLVPQTYGDWSSLGIDIKEKDPSITVKVNNALYDIGEENEYADRQKQWLIEKAGELGIR